MTAVLKDSPRQRRGHDTRARLMEAATGVLARSGFDRATVDEIVREAGFSKGAFYVHFETKEDLLWAMLEERISRQQDAFRQAVEHTQPLADNVRMILSGVFKLLRDDPLWGSLYAEFAAHASRNDKVRERLAAMYDRWRELIVDILSASRDAGRTRKDIDLRFAATLLIATVEGSIMQSHLAPETVRLDEMLEPLTLTLSGWLAPD